MVSFWNYSTSLQRSRVKILLKGKYQRGTYLHLWRKLTIGGIVQRSELLTVNQRIMVRVHVPQLLKSWQGKNPFGVEASPCGIIKTFSDTIVDELREQHGCGLMLLEHDSNKKNLSGVVKLWNLNSGNLWVCHQLKRKSQKWAVSSNGQSAGFAHRKIGFESLRVHKLYLKNYESICSCSKLSPS